ncbi:MAG: hypothetical protein COB02_17085 [Candidatus Cloacimonadota bacterium]|nr:MAG: hypothetical protein COB02_17085 [Candidatus Cloacimonadota bacterium]
MNKLKYIMGFGLSILLSTNNIIAENIFPGVVKPIHDVELSFPIDGTALIRFVDEGDRVEIGSKLLKVDDSLQALEVSRRKLLWNDRTKLDSLNKQNNIIKGLYKSTKNLYEKTGSVSKDELKKLEIRVLSGDGTILGLEQLEKKEKLEYEIARQVLSKYLLNSPIKGIVTNVAIEVGEWVKTGGPVVRIVDNSICYLEVNIEEKYIQRLKLNSEVKISIKSGDLFIDKKAIVTFVSPIADQASGLVLIRAQFDNQDEKIIPGITGEISFVD